jgi:hypothetical protein
MDGDAGDVSDAIKGWAKSLSAEDVARVQKIISDEALDVRAHAQVAVDRLIAAEAPTDLETLLKLGRGLRIANVERMKLRELVDAIEGHVELRRWEKRLDDMGRGQSPAAAGETQAKSTGDDNALAALLTVFTNGVSDERITQAAALLSDASLTVDEKLTKIDALIPFPPTASAEKLGDMLGGVTKQSVAKSDWWKQNRKGEKQNEIGRRQGRRREQSNHLDDGPEDDGE